MRYTLILALGCLVIGSQVRNSDGQNNMINQIGSAVGGAAQCLAKIGDCSSVKPDDQDKDQKRSYCCTSAAFSRCVQRLVDSTCPGTPINQIATITETGGAGTHCEGYTFWTPDCLYTNYMIAVIGSAVGLAVVLLLIIICVCCCCCRSKK